MGMDDFINKFLSGCNCTLIAYGQTGSGKTHSVFGEASSLKKNSADTAGWGLFPRTVVDILNRT
jgi:hypothetical protein